VLPSQLIAFIIGYALLVAVVFKQGGALKAIASLIAVYLIYTGIWHDPKIIVDGIIQLKDWVNLRVFVYLFFSLIIAGVLKETGYLTKLVETTSGISCRFSFLGVPALIGLLPMPGGALVSAIAMKEKYLDEAHMSREWASYLNYWFRHIWVPSWPLFQSVLITSAVLEIRPVDVISRTWPGTVGAIVAGLLVSLPALLKYTCHKGLRSLKVFLEAIWPFIFLAVLVFLLKIGLLYSLIITLVAVILFTRPSSKELINALKLATSPRLHGVLFEALYLKNVLILTKAPEAFYTTALSAGLPPWLVAYSVPFILGLAAGGENFFAATAMPLLKNYIIHNGTLNSALLLISYLGGYLGVMASPVHLCFALTVEYYKANGGKVLALSLLSIAITSALIVPVGLGLL
jgi:integral membrane protein (TIGR00529 family)